jgi:ligand-binding SRPBCC domain-containing protein
MSAEKFVDPATAPPMPRFSTQVQLPTTPERAYEFFRVPANIAKISPPELGLVFVNAPSKIEVGSELTFKVQAFGQVQTLTHRVVTLETPGLIVEEMVKGPFKRWYHRHSFVVVGEGGGVEVRDEIEFEPPGGFLGVFLKESTILDQLEDGFFHRHGQLKKLFANG